jgi:hypothetical protein
MLCERCGGLASLARAPYLCSRCAETLPELARTIAARTPRPAPAGRDRAGGAHPGRIAGILGCVVSALTLIGALMMLAAIRPAEPRTAWMIGFAGLGLGVAGVGAAIFAITLHRAGMIGTAVVQLLDALLLVLGTIGGEADAASVVTGAVLAVTAVVAAVLGVLGARA